jgi:hypothetical protein
MFWCGSHHYGKKLNDKTITSQVIYKSIPLIKPLKHFINKYFDNLIKIEMLRGIEGNNFRIYSCWDIEECDGINFPFYHPLTGCIELVKIRKYIKLEKSSIIEFSPTGFIYFIKKNN